MNVDKFKHESCSIKEEKPGRTVNFAVTCTESKSISSLHMKSNGTMMTM
jgi:hypothetical protein